MGVVFGLSILFTIIENNYMKMFLLKITNERKNFLCLLKLDSLIKKLPPFIILLVIIMHCTYEAIILQHHQFQSSKGARDENGCSFAGILRVLSRVFEGWGVGDFEKKFPASACRKKKIACSTNVIEKNVFTAVRKKQMLQNYCFICAMHYFLKQYYKWTYFLLKNQVLIDKGRKHFHVIIFYDGG